MAKGPPANVGDTGCRLDPWVRKIPWRSKWQPTPVFLPGKSHEQRNLMGYSTWGHTESRTTERPCSSLSKLKLGRNFSKITT